MNFDFHNLLFPEEFENLCRDILEIRENPITFTTYRRGRDGGIDIKSTNTSNKVIGQCKLYNPKDYNTLKVALKKELVKCKRLKPDRYILCINYELNVKEEKEIQDLFEGYIVNEEDIVDGIKLNKYLGLSEYKYLLKTYSKLLVPNLNLVEKALENVINKQFNNKTKSFFKTIAKEQKLYHNTKILHSCIECLEENKVLILTGNPGVGKTTTAKMIANYFSQVRRDSVIFLEYNDFYSIDGLYNNNQLIIVDDFWGQNFSPDLKKGSLLREFNRIIEDYKRSSNSYLLLTSREYIIKDVWNNSEFETKDILENEKYIISLNEYSEEDKVKIFLNHLLFFDFNKEYFSYLKYDDILERIINHRNYSPRHIEYFIKQYLKSEESSRYTFFKGFYKYLDNPQEYWDNNFHKLNDTSQLILLIILISSDPIDKSDLEMTFDRVQESIRRVLNKNIQPIDFETELSLLEDFYIVSNKIFFLDDVSIRFQSPGIKDYLLEYLRGKGKAWIAPLIGNVPFLNQLYFVFSTEEQKINDYDVDINLFGKKIILSSSIQKTLKQRLLSEFYSLNFCNPRSKDFTDLHTKYESPDKTKYWKLTLLNRLFDIEKVENNDVKEFVVNEVIDDINDFTAEKNKIIDAGSMVYFPNIIKLINPFVELDPSEILHIYYSSITLTIEFDYFYKFKDVFPKEFDEYYNKNIKDIRKLIRYHIVDDIDYYQWSDNDIELDMHLDYYIEEVCKKYGVRITAKLVEDIEGFSERQFRNYPIVKKRKSVPAKKKKSLYEGRFKPQKYETIINSYLPEDFDDFDPKAYLRSINLNKELIREIRKDLRSEESILDYFTGNYIIFSAVIQFLRNKKQNLDLYNCYSILDLFVIDYSNKLKIEKALLVDFFFTLINKGYQYDFSITKSQIEKMIVRKKLPIENIESLSPIIIADKNWFKLSANRFQIYFIVEYLVSIVKDEVFKEKVMEYTYEVNEPDVLNTLSFCCQNRLTEVVIVPELDRFISQIDTTSEKSIVLSIINFFQVEFELEWLKKERGFGLSCGSYSEGFVELILQYLNIDFRVGFLENYFIQDYYDGEYMNIKGFQALYNRMISTLVSEKKTLMFNNYEGIYYKVKLKDFALDNDNYTLLINVGFERYVLDVFGAVKDNLRKIKEVNRI